MSFKSLLMTWFKRAPVIVGLLCFILAVWFGGPLIAIGQSRPLDPVWIRITIIAVGVTLVLAFYSSAGGADAARPRRSRRRSRTPGALPATARCLPSACPRRSTR